MKWASLIAGMLLTAASVGLIACAGATSREAAPPAAPMAPAAPPQPAIEGPVQDISQLYGEIRGFRREMGMESEPGADAINQFTRQPVAHVDTCEATTNTCTDVCTLADHICENAEDICSITRDLTNDPSYGWARDKCNRANLSCNEARQQCCGCVDREKNGDVGQSSAGKKEPSTRWWN